MNDDNRGNSEDSQNLSFEVQKTLRLPEGQVRMNTIPIPCFGEINADIIQASESVFNEQRLFSVYASCPYYDDVREMICSVVRSLVKNHPFVDGNKRTALSAFFVLSHLNNIPIDEEKHYGEIIEGIARGNYNVDEIRKMLY